jgi:hypothetical protein
VQENPRNQQLRFRKAEGEADTLLKVLDHEANRQFL